MYSLGLDIGSSSIKAAIVEIANASILSSVKYPEQEMKIYSPHATWAEQHPQEWWDYVLKAIESAIHASKIDPKQIKSIGISYQMHGLVALDKNGEVVRPSIIWCDSRAIQAGEAINARLSGDVLKNNIYNKPGNFTASKLYWVKENETQLFEKIDKVMLPGDYIAYKMSGTMASTYSGMSEGNFYDFKNHEISKDVMNAAGFSHDLIPSLGNSFDVLAETDASFEKLTGISNGTPISYRAGDQPNNAFALGVINDGEAAATGGTSGVVYAVSNQVKYDEASRVNSFAHVNHKKENPKIGTLLCINGTGISHNWVRSNHFTDTSYNELEAIAKSAAIGSEGLINIPFGNGAERMLGNKLIGASIQNLDFNRHNRSHIVRAGLEGIAFAFVYGMEAMKELGIDVSKIRAGNDNLFQSSVFSNTLSTLGNAQIDIFETTGAVGAAKGAAFGAGLYSTIDEAISNIEKVKTIEPSVSKDEYNEAYERWKIALKKLM